MSFPSNRKLISLARDHHRKGRAFKAWMLLQSVQSSGELSIDDFSSSIDCMIEMGLSSQLIDFVSQGKCRFQDESAMGACLEKVRRHVVSIVQDAILKREFGLSDEILWRLLRLFPNDATVLMLISLSKYRQNDTVMSCSFLGAAIRSDKENHLIHSNAWRILTYAVSRSDGMDAMKACRLDAFDQDVADDLLYVAQRSGVNEFVAYSQGYVNLCRDVKSALGCARNSVGSGGEFLALIDRCFSNPIVTNQSHYYVSLSNVLGQAFRVENSCLDELNKHGLLNDDVEVYSVAAGRYAIPAGGTFDEVCMCIMSGRKFEEEMLQYALSCLNEGDVVVDVGANVGYMSVAFSRAVGGRGRVYSIEGDDFVFRCLKATLDLNGCNNVIPINAIISSEDGRCFAPSVRDHAERTYGDKQMLPVDGMGGVKSVAVDTLIGNEKVALIKVDIEGADLAAIQGAKRLIEENRPVIIFECNQQWDAFGVSIDDAVSFFDSVGYRIEKVIGHNYVARSVPTR